MSARKSEDFIDRKHENKPGGGRIKNVGGEGLDSMPKAGKQVGPTKGSGDLGKEERRQVRACKICNGTKLVKGAACPGCKTAKAEVGVPTAKPPSGNAQNKPAPVPPQPKVPKMPTQAPKMPGVAKAEHIRSQMLSVADTSASSLTVGQLAEGAAHHYLLMERAMLRKDEGAAARHAHAGTLMERLIGCDPRVGPSQPVQRAMARLDGEFRKSEPGTGFQPSAHDAVVGEDRLWRSMPLAKAIGRPASAPGAGAFGLPGVKGPTAGPLNVPTEPMLQGKPRWGGIPNQEKLQAMKGVRIGPSEVPADNVGRKAGKWPSIGSGRSAPRDSGEGPIAPNPGVRAMPVSSHSAGTKPHPGPALPGVTGRKPISGGR